MYSAKAQSISERLIVMFVVSHRWRVQPCNINIQSSTCDYFVCPSVPYYWTEIRNAVMLYDTPQRVSVRVNSLLTILATAIKQAIILFVWNSRMH